MLFNDLNQIGVISRDVQRSVNKSDGQARAHFFISSLHPPPLLAEEPHSVLLYHLI